MNNMEYSKLGDSSGENREYPSVNITKVIEDTRKKMQDYNSEHNIHEEVTFKEATVTVLINEVGNYASDFAGEDAKSSTGYETFQEAWNDSPEIGKKWTKVYQTTETAFLSLMMESLREKLASNDARQRKPKRYYRQ